MHKYRLISKKGEGTFSEVLKAQSIKTGEYTAIKCMKNHFDNIDQVNNLREIQALQRLSPNPHIVKLYEVLYDQPTGRLALVFELMSMNAYELIRGRRHYLSENTVKSYMYQLTKAMDHMHRSGIFHRDIKPENILIRDDVLKVADFGSCRGIYSKQPYTEYISTRWYRAPECLLTDGYYGYKMDMWGVGCVMFEIIALYPLFPGSNELDQIKKIHKVLGTPSDDVLMKFKAHGASHIEFDFPYYKGKSIAKSISHVSSECADLIRKLVRYEPEHRLSARQALRHPWFQELREMHQQQQQQRTSDCESTASEISRGSYNKSQRHRPRQHLRSGEMMIHNSSSTRTYVEEEEIEDEDVDEDEDEEEEDRHHHYIQRNHQHHHRHGNKKNKRSKWKQKYRSSKRRQEEEQQQDMSSFKYGPLKAHKSLPRIGKRNVLNVNSGLPKISGGSLHHQNTSHSTHHSTSTSKTKKIKLKLESSRMMGGGNTSSYHHSSYKASSNLRKYGIGTNRHNSGHTKYQFAPSSNMSSSFSKHHRTNGAGGGSSKFSNSTTSQYHHHSSSLSSKSKLSGHRMGLGPNSLSNRKRSGKVSKLSKLPKSYQSPYSQAYIQKMRAANRG